MALPDRPMVYITLEECGDILVVGFTMRMLNDEENIEQLGQELFALVEQYSWLKLALDMSSIDYITSSVIGKLITLHRKLHRSQGKLALFGLSSGVDTILATSKLLNYFTVATDKNSALALLV
jgi:anti-sigma B factor antagonist